MSTATKSRKSSRFGSYDDLIAHTEKPLASRRELAIGRGGAKVKPRRFHLGDDEVTALKDAIKKLGSKATMAEKLSAINPHNKGFYHDTFAALAEHPNEDVPMGRFMARIEKLMSADDTIQGEGKEKTTAWERFSDRDPRNADTGKDVEGRIEQNITVLQRLTGLTPYGRRIFDLGKVLGTKGVVIDVIVNPTTGTKYLRLNTNAERPVNQAKTRGMGSTAQLEADKLAAKEARKATKDAAKATASKPKVKRTKAKVEAPTAEAESPAEATAEVVA
jgi:hypothetical protein